MICFWGSLLILQVIVCLFICWLSNAILEVGEFIHTLGDYHIYHEHFDAIKIQIKREPKKLPNLIFNKKEILDYSLSDSY